MLHAGIADSRMWQPQIRPLEEAGYRVLAPDLRGFGGSRLEPAPFSHLRDAVGALDGSATVVGSSLGGRVALELALHRPDLVQRLVVIAPGLPGWEWSEETRAGWADEEKAYELGDFEAAAEASVRMWVDGPHRSPAEVDPGVRDSVRTMVLRSYEMQQGAWEAGAREEESLEPPLRDRLGEIRCPTLVLVGAEDIADMRAIATHVADSIKGAQLEIVPGASHIPSLERPAATNALLFPFLSGS